MGRTIFISSTYRDLKPHREKIWNTLQNFDVEITGMEEFGARQSTPLETCLNEIERSDIYIGIISMCYGSVDSITGKSYTQLEYERAKEKGLDVLIYLIDENKGEVLTGNIDFGSKNLSLNNFKSILKNNHTVDWFVSEEDLSQKIYKKLNKILQNTVISNIRPHILGARFYRFDLGSQKWGVFVGYNNGKPFEIFSALIDDYEGVLLPRSVSEGVIIKNSDENGIPRYDFQFENKRGFKTTLENMSYTYHSQIKTYDNIINELLNKGKHAESLEILKHMNFDNSELSNWNREVIKVLNR